MNVSVGGDAGPARCAGCLHPYHEGQVCRFAAANDSYALCTCKIDFALAFDDGEANAG